MHDDHDDDDEGGSWECSACGARPPNGPEEIENEDEDLWGPLGEVLAVCPECGAVDHGLG